MEDGGNAIVGNVTQHASMIAADWKPASAERRPPKTASGRRVRNSVGRRGMSAPTRATPARLLEEMK